MDFTLSLIKRIQQGERAAFNELYKQHYTSLLSYARLFLEADEAEDIVQDVFLNTWLNREKLDEAHSIRSYLLRSVYNSALNVLKKKGYSAGYQAEYEIKQMGYSQYDPDANEIIYRLYNEELNENIQAAIETLPAKCKEVFTLSYLEDMSSKEISKQLGIARSTVENHIYSALKQLREKLRRYH